jgi:hypothetical protein
MVISGIAQTNAEHFRFEKFIQFTLRPGIIFLAANYHLMDAVNQIQCFSDSKLRLISRKFPHMGALCMMQLSGKWLRQEEKSRAAVSAEASAKADRAVVQFCIVHFRTSSVSFPYTSSAAISEASLN